MAGASHKPVFRTGRAGWPPAIGSGAGGPKSRRKKPSVRPDPRPIDDVLHLLPVPAHAVGARVVLPYPPRDLSPNARVSRFTLAKVKQSYRRVCWALALEAKLRIPDYASDTAFGAGGTLFVRLDFFPPSATAPDDDNLEAAFKAGRDGVADAIHCDDKRWTVSRVLHAQARSCVVLTIIDPGAAQFGLSLEAPKPNGGAA